MPTELGTVSDKYRKLHCVALTPEVPFKRGAHVKFTHTGGDGHPPIDFDQAVNSIEINHTAVEEAIAGVPCGIKIDDANPLPPLGATVYLVD